MRRSEKDFTVLLAVSHKGTWGLRTSAPRLGTAMAVHFADRWLMFMKCD